MGVGIAIAEFGAHTCDLDSQDIGARDLEMADAVEPCLTTARDIATLTDLVCWGLNDAPAQDAHVRAERQRCRQADASRAARHTL